MRPAENKGRSKFVSLVTILMLLGILGLALFGHLAASWTRKVDCQPHGSHAALSIAREIHSAPSPVSQIHCFRDSRQTVLPGWFCFV